eukprot:3083372-Rhodomonas_salina.1
MEFEWGRKNWKRSRKSYEYDYIVVRASSEVLQYGPQTDRISTQPHYRQKLTVLSVTVETGDRHFPVLAELKTVIGGPKETTVHPGDGRFPGDDKDSAPGPPAVQHNASCLIPL